jgi:4-hydroxy-2-oxoheptanedioate aldolase
MEKLKSILINLKTLGCVGIKISFEDEGALLSEHTIMSILTSSLDLDLAIKIGGCEAKRDIVDCIMLNATSIVAPMIESKFALKKYIDSLNQYNFKNQVGFNLETINAYNNLDSIKEYFSSIDYVTFGRVDFVNSLNKDRKHVDSDEIFDYVKTVFTNTRKYNKKCYLGGAISIDSEKFILELNKEDLIDRFETRYVIFDIKKVIDFNKAIYYANLFELEWMNYIRNIYLSHANKDIKRIDMIEQRINKNVI